MVLGLNKAIDQLSTANSVCSIALRREDGHVLRGAFEFEVEGQRKKVIGRKCEGWFEKGRCSLPIKVVCQC